MIKICSIVCSKFIIALAILILLQACTTTNQPIQGKDNRVSDEVLLFDQSLWGQSDLIRKQNSNQRFIESVLNTNSNFEQLSGYPVDKRTRKISKPIGRLDIRFQSNKFTTCTATVIGLDIILTNHHCVPGTGDHGPIAEVSLFMGFYNLIDTEGTARYEVESKPLQSDSELDYALLKVNTNVGLDWGIARLGSSLPDPGQSLLLIHHPGGAVKHVTRGKCQAMHPTPIKGSDLFHKCDSLPGSSGGPILLGDTGEVIALHYAGSTLQGPDAFNYSKLVSEISSVDKTIAAAVRLSEEHSRQIEIAPNSPATLKKYTELSSAQQSIPETQTQTEARTTTNSSSNTAKIDTRDFRVEVFFEPNSNVLTQLSEQALFDLRRDLSEYKGITNANVLGHSDTQEARGNGEELSVSRAVSVGEFLADFYPDLLININGFGDSKPVATNDTSEGRQLNRRVEVQITATRMLFQ